jgi:hypothetical protein
MSPDQETAYMRNVRLNCKHEKMATMQEYLPDLREGRRFRCCLSCSHAEPSRDLCLQSRSTG